MRTLRAPLRAPSAALLLVVAVSGCAAENNGFDLRGSRVPAQDIHVGGPPRDGKRRRAGANTAIRRQ